MGHAFRTTATLVLLQGILIGAQNAPRQQTPESAGTSHSGTQIITLNDAVARARKYGTQIQSAELALELANEDRKQAKAATLPTVNGINQFIYTEGNGTPSGVFVANDGVHVYNEEAWVHEDLLPFVRRGEIRLASASAALAKAKLDVAARGLTVTVVQDYYAIASARSKVTNAETSLKEAQQFLETARKQEQGGEVAHADVIKAQLQVEQRQRDIQDAQLAMDKAKINLAILIFPSLSLDFSTAEEGSEVPSLPAAPADLQQVQSGNPEMRAAKAAVTQAREGISVARNGYLPTFGLDFWYGIDANEFAAQSTSQSTGRSTLPNYLVENRQNLGYSAAATLTIPLWNWGAVRSKVKQANLKERQTELDLAATKKQVDADLTASYKEASAALAQVDSLRSSSTLSDESLRLTLLRYQAGEATALEVVDAQTTANQARNAYDDGLTRYRVAVANLRSLLGAI